MKAGDFIEQSLKTSDTDTLVGLFRRALADYGVDRFIYGALRNAPRTLTAFPGIASSYPEGWTQYYISQGYLDIDPTCARILTSRRAFTWNALMREQTLSKEQQGVMDQGREAGLLNGAAVPFHGPLGEVFGIGVASSSPNPDIEVLLPTIQVIATQFHNSYSTTFEPHKPKKSILTPRETEVLKWAAAGKSNWAIGEILSISEHGVDFHMRNILRKLEADSRLTAVIKALHKGLITL